MGRPAPQDSHVREYSVPGPGPLWGATRCCPRHAGTTEPNLCIVARGCPKEWALLCRAPWRPCQCGINRLPPLQVVGDSPLHEQGRILEARTGMRRKASPTNPASQSGVPVGTVTRGGGGKQVSSGDLRLLPEQLVAPVFETRSTAKQVRLVWRGVKR